MDARCCEIWDVLGRVRYVWTYDHTLHIYNYAPRCESEDVSSVCHGMQNVLDTLYIWKDVHLKTINNEKFKFPCEIVILLHVP